MGNLGCDKFIKIIVPKKVPNHYQVIRLVLFIFDPYFQPFPFEKKESAGVKVL
jgi:hypothetical protein